MITIDSTSRTLKNVDIIWVTYAVTDTPQRTTFQIICSVSPACLVVSTLLTHLHVNWKENNE